MYVQNLGYTLPVKLVCPKATYLQRLSITSQLSGKFNSEYNRKETLAFE